MLWLLLVIAVSIGAALGYAVARRFDDDPYELAQLPEHLPAGVPSHQRLHALLDRLQTGVIVLDADDRVMLVNPAAAKIFGTTAERMGGRALIEATNSAELERRAAAAKQGDGARTACEIVTLGTTHLLEIQVVWVDEEERLILLHDVTLARENERIRREFLGNVSHELRTPLAGIKLMFETLEAVDTLDARAHFFPLIGSEIDRLVEIVEHLLDVARAEGGRLDLRREPLDLSVLVKAALTRIEARIEESGITLSVRGENCPILGDPGRLQQVLTNLVENALRHTAAGGRIQVSTGIRSEQAFLEVEDTGTGIPFKDLPHIFERFYVVDRSRAKATGGLGLGLALVKGTVEGLDGRIDVRSELGFGSCFTAYFPLRVDSSAGSAA